MDVNNINIQVVFDHILCSASFSITFAPDQTLPVLAFIAVIIAGTMSLIAS